MALSDWRGKVFDGEIRGESGPPPVLMVAGVAAPRIWNADLGLALPLILNSVKVEAWAGAVSIDGKSGLAGGFEALKGGSLRLSFTFCFLLVCRASSCGSAEDLESAVANS